MIVETIINCHDRLNGPLDLIHKTISSDELLSLSKANMKWEGSGNITNLKIESHICTKFLTRSPIKSSLIIIPRKISIRGKRNGLFHWTSTRNFSDLRHNYTCKAPLIVVRKEAERDRREKSRKIETHCYLLHV